MTKPDIRWQQRFKNFTTAFAQLKEAIELLRQRPLTQLEKQGVIQAFEFTYELAWNTLKDYLAWQGIEDIVGSRDTIREAFNKNLIADGDAWMVMLVDRNKTSHTYNQDIAQAILENIDNSHYRLFFAFEDKMTELMQRKE